MAFRQQTSMHLQGVNDTEVLSNDIGNILNTTENLNDGINKLNIKTIESIKELNKL